MCINEMRDKLDFVYFVITFKISNIIVLLLSIVIFNAAIFMAMLLVVRLLNCLFSLCISDYFAHIEEDIRRIVELQSA